MRDRLALALSRWICRHLASKDALAKIAREALSACDTRPASFYAVPFDITTTAGNATVTYRSVP